MSMTVKQKLISGQKVAGTMLRVVRNPAVMYIAKNAGLDYVMFDCEHSNYSIETLHDAFLSANAYGIAGFVRVPVGTRDHISRVLDAGASGVMVPMVETLAQAQKLVKYSKYQPVGGRGYTAGGAHTNYMGGKHSEIMEDGNARVVTIAQIETKLAIENVEEIATVEGIDALLIGPNDLSISLGIPGDMMNPIELEAIAKVAAACKKCGKAFGLHAGAELLEKFARELTLVMSLSDTDVLAQGFAGVRLICDGLKEARE